MAKKETKTKASKAARPAARAVSSKDILVVGTKMKDVVRNAGCMSSSELLEAVSDKVQAMLMAASQRAKENGRTTVRPYDL